MYTIQCFHSYLSIYANQPIFKFDLDIFRRSLSVPIPQSHPDSFPQGVLPQSIIPQSIPDPVSQIGSKVTGALNAVSSQVDSAIASAETLASQSLSVGTKSACIVHNSQNDCEKLSTFFQKISSLVPSLKVPHNFLDHTPSLEVILIIGLACNIASTIFYTPVYRFARLGYLSAGFSLLSFVMCAIFTVFTQMIINFASNIKGSSTLERGEADIGSIGLVASSGFHCFFSSFSVFII